MHESIEITVPVRIVSEMNTREHWRVRDGRFRTHKYAVHYALANHRAQLREIAAEGPIVVTLTRIGKKTLDTDNLASGFKACRDEVAGVLGIDDGSPRITWNYEQQAGREYAAIIRIERG